MSWPGDFPRLLQAALLLAGVGALAALALFVAPGPYSLVLFMFVAQPLLFLGMLLFGLQVFRDLRSRQVL